MRYFLPWLLSFLLTPSSQAAEVLVAVAANFAAPMKHIAAMFEKESGHTVSLSFGATGKFYSQIKHAAPYDVLVAADQAIPIRLEQQHAAVKGSRFTYATGKLVLWSAQTDLIDARGAILSSGQFRHLATASPTQAPYGRAARQTLVALNLFDKLSSKIVQGESIGQTYSFVATGNAELGLVALSQVKENNQKPGSMWIVPAHLHSPLYQDAILLKHGQRNLAAIALLDYLKSHSAKHIIRSYGYDC